MSKGIALLNLIEGHTAVTAPPALLSIIYIMALFANNVILYGYAFCFYIRVPRHGPHLLCFLPKVNVSPQELLHRYVLVNNNYVFSSIVCLGTIYAVMQLKAYTCRS